jgi:hypothetical protein
LLRGVDCEDQHRPLLLLIDDRIVDLDLDIRERQKQMAIIPAWRLTGGWATSTTAG